MSRSILLALVAFVATGAPLIAVARPCGQQAPCGPIVLEGPIPAPFPAGDPLANPHIPGGGHGVDTLAQPTVEEEFFFSGSVDVYNYDAFPAARGDHPGDRLVVYKAAQPYKTRMLVRRPASADAFSGDVVIEMMNSSALFDSTPSWLPSAEYFAREGIVYIGVTTSGNQSLPFLKNGCGGVQPPCGSRYASLSITDNGQEYEIISQLATALKGGDPSQIPLPADFGPVQHVFLSGQSQQGGSVITYASQFHFPGMDGYFFMGASSSRAIRGGFAPADPSSLTCGSTGAPTYPDCVSVLGGAELRVRTDLPVPVYRGSSETDIGDGSTRQDDSDTSIQASFRLIEVPATSHNLVHDFDFAPGLPFAFLCVAQPYSLADGPIFGSHVWNAMWENMRIQVTQGVLPPHAPRVELVGGVIQRDGFENALGGVRLPELDVPTNSYFSPNNQGKPACGSPGAPPPPGCIPPELSFIANLACRLNGSYEPLPPEVLDELYPNHGRYVRQIAERTNALVKARFLLPDDAVLHKTAAGEAPFGH